jgi:hypothetical protein
VADRSVLAERYASANAIVVAQANSCPGTALADGSRCPGEEYQFSILEVLKDSGSARDFSGTFRGGNAMGCGLIFRLGQSYLLFLDDEGQPLHSTSGYLGDEYSRSASVKESLHILREYRDNIIDDLSGPWAFSDTGLSCEIRHRFSGASISFSFDYRLEEFWDDVLVLREGSGPRGESLYRVDNDIYKRSRGEIIHEFDYDGPDFEPESIVFRVIINNRKDASDGFITVAVGKQSWRLNPMTVTMSGTRVSKSVYVSDMLGGDAALALLRELNGESKEITITTNQKDEAHALNYQKLIKTRSTQFTRSEASFDKCIIGEKRRGAIITRRL